MIVVKEAITIARRYELKSTEKQTDARSRRGEFRFIHYVSLSNQHLP